MTEPLTLTIDLEDPTGAYAPDGRYIHMTEHVLDLCDETGCRATFFCVGQIAEAAPDLIRKIASKGHEIAYHSHAHLSLTEDTPGNFHAQTLADKTLLETLAGRPVVGFRAPRFSLTPTTLWATDVLAELGFEYSSSIMPTAISRFGFRGAPATPFVWPAGVLEVPLPIATLFGLRLPYLGGIYLYMMPFACIRFLLAKAGPEEMLWSYAHPYDFDRESPYVPMQDTPGWVSRILWLARRLAEPKIRKLLKLAPHTPPLRDRIPGWRIRHGI